jgi:hypothetical protein
LFQHLPGGEAADARLRSTASTCGRVSWCAVAGSGASSSKSHSTG